MRQAPCTNFCVDDNFTPAVYDLYELKLILEKWHAGMEGEACPWFLNNHDLPRLLSSWGDKGAFIYQGEESG